MNRFSLRLAVVCLLAPLGGCITSAGLAPNAIPQPGVVALGEGLIGRTPGLALPDSARAAGLEAEFQALQFGRAGQAVTWADGNFGGEVVPTQLYRVGSQDCRGYSHTVTAGPKAVRETGTACRTEAGFWTPIA